MTSFDKPETTTLQGAYVVLEKACPAAHKDDFQSHLCGVPNAPLWEYLPFGPFESADQMFASLEMGRKQLGWQSFAMRPHASGQAEGTISLMRIRSDHGSSEIGAVVFGHGLQKTAAATEAIFLLAHYVFDTLGYRRLEWKCDNNNAASKRAAFRFGFQFEGVFRNDMIVKGKSRDTAWFAMTDDDWTDLRGGYLDWLDPVNFTNDGSQRSSLRELIDSNY
ncbi:MAG: GNAT family protein [Pseudomonadota bacterium]